ncbi:PTS sugar transporter subunit IIA [Micropruina sonneratiae]|uniref:PTS sugar transporter subunit IIA n=1 Tax=Micropruina sonneratiae TaxID=2986940 RepID=UPI00222652AB|nr:PTS sugar transporter subunit IIA [Micropruina sp. KQZ13P-5]MCW3156937.1 PTS sugar transporter subunit IIA [Micropruina sp. KQZ13P-5]
MPNIPALIAWGILTMFFIPAGFTPNEAIATIVGPMIHYLLPIIIAYTGGHMVYGLRGAVVASIGVMGAIAGSDYLIAQENVRLLEAWVAAGNAEADFSELGQVHMFIGAMIMAPLSAYSMRWLDKLWENKIKAGLEMLVNMFSAGIWGFFLMIIGFYPIAWLVNGLMSVLSSAVNWLVANNLLPLTSIIIEPAKVLFLNNAINHGVLTPLGLAQAGDAAYNNRSILFLLESNPGPGLGLLLAFALVGVGAARASAPGAAFIQFIGGIHEVYFPYALMKPALILALIGGGMTGVTTNMLLGGALRAPAAPGSILAVLAQTAPGAYVAVALSVVLSAAVTFLIAAAILRASRKTDLAAEAAGEDKFASAVSQTAANKGKSSDALSGLLSSSAAAPSGQVKSIVFACDAGMGSSAMGASVLRKKIQQAGFSEVTVINKAIASLDDAYDVVVSHEDLMDRAAQRTPSAVHVAVDNFMSSPRYDEVVEMVRRVNSGPSAETDAPVPAPTPAQDVPAPEPEPAPAEATEEAAAPEVAATSAAVAEPAADEDSAVLKLSSIQLAGTASDRNGAIDEAGALLVSSGNVDSAYVESMHEREKSVSTYMGNLLAIPHGTNEAKALIKSSSISVVRYPGGIDWNGNPVKFVIGIAGAGNDHLELLGKIAEVFLDESRIAELEQATSAQEIRDAFGRVNS